MDKQCLTRLAALIVSISSALLPACNSSSNSDSDSSTADGPTTTLGTRASVSVANSPITDNAAATWTDYSRPEDYPGVLRLPLKFFTLTSGPNAGKKLGVLVSVPADANGEAIKGRFPVILTQNSYGIYLGATLSKLLHSGNTMAIGGTDDDMIKRGYITVSTDILGTGVSDGEDQLFGDPEQQACGDTVNWVIKQSWSNGIVGLAGTSQLGIDALLTAEQGNPAVKAAFVQVPMGDAWRDTIGTGGQLNGLFISIWLTLTQNLSVANGPALAANPQYADQINSATQQHVAAINDMDIPLVNAALNGDTGDATDDGDFWSQRSPVERASSIPVPTFIIGGTHDIFQRGEPLLYEQLKHSVTTKLVIMPGDHVQVVAGTLKASDATGEDGPPTAAAMLLQWFDQYLKGMDTGADKMPTVTQYVDGYGSNGAARFASTTDWPHPLATPQRLYLHGDMTLSDQLPSSGEATHTMAEPAAPDPVIGTNSEGNLLVMKGTPVDASECSVSYQQWTLGLTVTRPCYSNDANVERAQAALNYETAAETDNVYINGPMEADIWVSSSVTAAAVSVRIDDVGTDGTVTPITNGLLSASYRAIDDSRSRYLQGTMIQPWHPFTIASVMPVVPGQPMLLPVEIFPDAAVIRTGHKLRVAISASNQSQGIWPQPEQSMATGGVSTIYSDADHPSSLVLPVVPASVLSGL